MSEAVYDDDDETLITISSIVVCTIKCAWIIPLRKQIRYELHTLTPTFHSQHPSTLAFGILFLSFFYDCMLAELEESWMWFTVNILALEIIRRLVRRKKILLCWRN